MSRLTEGALQAGRTQTEAVASAAPAAREARRWVQGLTAAVAAARRWEATGRVVELVGLTVVAEGPPSAVGELCLIGLPDGSAQLPAQVVGFRHGLTLLLPLTRMAGVEPGCVVRAMATPLTAPVGEGVLGRVLDAFGNPLDGGGSIGRCQRRPVETPPPPALQRRRVLEPMYFGIRALDGLLTCGKGQRIGVFSGAGVGKSSLLGMMARHTDADVIVVALVGERGREVRDFIEARLTDALPRSVVVAATSDEPALVRITAGLTATTIAEYFRDQGRSVLLIVDSLTRLARAQREAGLAAGETPTTRGFPPSVYEFLPRLLERAGGGVASGAGPAGAITGVYSVLVEGDDMQEPVADAVSAILDGHIVLSRELADQGHHPAIDVTASVSRLMEQVVDGEHRAAARRVRALVAARAEVEDLVAVGAYHPGSHALADQALRQWPQLTAFLRQDCDERSEAAATRRAILRLGAPSGSG